MKPFPAKHFRATIANCKNLIILYNLEKELPAAYMWLYVAMNLSLSWWIYFSACYLNYNMMYKYLNRAYAVTQNPYTYIYIYIALP